MIENFLDKNAINNELRKLGHDIKKIAERLGENNLRELGIKEITLYTLSTENLKRSPSELNFLFDLYVRWFKKFKKDTRIKGVLLSLSIE